MKNARVSEHVRPALGILTVALSALSALSACSSAELVAVHRGKEDAGESALADGGDGGPEETPSATYPAFRPDIAQLVNQGGVVLAKPIIVTITWPNDARVATYEKLGDVIGTTSYWSAIAAEYGVGPATSGPANHVHTTTPAGSAFSIAALEQLVMTTARSVPLRGTDAIYVMYLPINASVDMGDGQDSCQSSYGFHGNVLVDGQQAVYAVMCQLPNESLDDVTFSATHEIAEASLDPYPFDVLTWAGVDAAHLAWDRMQMGLTESADMCDFYPSSSLRAPVPELPFTVERGWSNKSAAGGHAPCVPAPAEPYFNVTLLGSEDLTVDMSPEMGPANQKTKGVRLAVGASKTIPLGFYSDAPSDAWSLEAIELDPFARAVDPFAPTPKKSLDLSLDRKSGKNGTVANLTVTLNATTPMKASLVLMVSTLGSEHHYMPFLVGGE